jgi:hypothetical protein
MWRSVVPDVPARIGVPVYEMLPARPGVFGSTLGWPDPTHLAFPTSPEAVAEMREVIARELFRVVETDAFIAADAVLRALGLVSDA